jgi:hypothetical protein
MSDLYRMLIAPLIALVAATSVAEATCGDSGGPGYRGPNRECVGWEALGRVRMPAQHALHSRANRP